MWFVFLNVELLHLLIHKGCASDKYWGINTKNPGILQQDYYGQQYSTLLHSYYSCTYTEVTILEVASLLPWSTHHAGTPTEWLYQVLQSNTSAVTV